MVIGKHRKAAVLIRRDRGEDLSVERRYPPSVEPPREAADRTNPVQKPNLPIGTPLSTK